MKSPLTRLLTLVFALGFIGLSFQADSEDIDIFSVDSGNTVQVPNVLFVIDNSANWSRQSQQWPEAEIQGQSEVDAIRQVIQGLTTNVNVGMLEFVTGGSASDEDSGYVRYHIRPMTTSNKAAFSGILAHIYAGNNVNDPIEKRPQSNPFGTLWWDVYNYLAGIDHSNHGTGTPNIADASAYSNLYSTFHSPLTNADSCRRTVVIFIGNNVQAGPSGDSAADIAALRQLATDAGGGDTTVGDAAITQIPFADYVVTSVPAVARNGYSACFSSTSACNSSLNAATPTGTVCTDMGFTSCSCDSTDTIACPSTHWTVVGSNTARSVTSSAPSPSTTTATDANSITYSCTTQAKMSPLDSSTTCPASSDNGPPTTSTPNGTYTETATSWSSCKYVRNGATGCTGGSSSDPKTNWILSGEKTVTTTTWTVANVTTQTTLGNSSACYNDTASCTSVSGGFGCPSGTYNNGCSCTAATDTTGCGAGLAKQFQQLGNYLITAARQTGTYHAAPTTNPNIYMMDEWARFLRQVGVPIPGGGGARSQVTTYTIDVFNQQQHPDFSALLFNAARVGGGKYFQAKDKNALISALKQIFNEVQAVNSAFSSASLPVNATNRAQNENQVFIGVFKPDKTKHPLWFGNLKRYQLISSGSTIDLGDANGILAINPNTGFITDCATSYWTTDSTFNGIPYWDHNSITNPIPQGTCSTNTTSDLSDSPDGPFVEKGAAAEVLRKGNDPLATPDSDGNYVLNRTVYTLSGGALTAFNATNSGLVQATVDFAVGHDVLDEDTDAAAAPAEPRALTEPRSTIHGDVIHSRPQPINFGGSTGVVVFYGSNDGVYRAVKASTGQELWSFIAPEHYARLQRLYDNSPNVLYFNDSPIGAAPKDYFFDGSTGVYQTFNTDGTSNTAWIFPSMHRGGRKLYAFNVSNPASPVYLWSKGCPDLTDDTGCDAGFSNIGQTWSLPNVAFIKGYSGGTRPVVVIGGGYDKSDDENTKTPGAASKGRGIFVIDAQSGALVRFFDFSALSGVTARSVAADVALIDVDNDKMVDYAYAADTAGNIYRVDFVTGPTPVTANTTSSSWAMQRVAYTNGAARKFLFTPALLQATANVVYLALGSGDREHPLESQYPFGSDYNSTPPPCDVTCALSDPTKAVLNRFYVFKDDINASPVTAFNLDNADPTDPNAMKDFTSGTTCTTPAITPSSTNKGWFINENAQGQGEQTVTSAVIAAGFVFFSTNRPTPDSTTACTTSLGEARGYFMSLLNASGSIGVGGACGGARSSTFVGGGLPPSPVLATVPINGEMRTVVIGAVQKTGTASSPIEAQRVRPPISSKRTPVYWYKSSGDN